MTRELAVTYYSDVLCVWAHIAQPRVDEVARKFAGDVTITYRFCSVFGDAAHKIGVGWSARGGYEGFAAHLHEAVSEFDHVELHSEGSFIDAELVIRSTRLGYEMLQFGVDYFPRTRGESTLGSPGVILTILREMIQLRGELSRIEPAVDRDHAGL